MGHPRWDDKKPSICGDRLGRRSPQRQEKENPRGHDPSRARDKRIVPLQKRRKEIRREKTQETSLKRGQYLKVRGLFAGGDGFGMRWGRGFVEFAGGHAFGGGGNFFLSEDGIGAGVGEGFGLNGVDGSLLCGRCVAMSGGEYAGGGFRNGKIFERVRVRRIRGELRRRIPVETAMPSSVPSASRARASNSLRLGSSSRSLRPKRMRNSLEDL